MATSAASAISQANSIGIQDFLKILTTQLNNQDPMKPLDNQEFLSQIAQFSTLQQSQVLNEKVDQVLSTQSSMQSVGLLGKDIKFTSGVDATTAGKVTGISFSNGTPSLTVTSTAGVILQGIAISQITSISAPI